MWEPHRENEPVKKVDCQRVTESIQRTYKATRITNKLKVTKHLRSLSKVKGYKERTFRQELMRDFAPKKFAPIVNYDLFGDAFHD